MMTIQKIGIALFVFALAIFTLVPGLNFYQLEQGSIRITNEYHATAFAKAAQKQSLYDTDYGSTFALQSALNEAFDMAQKDLNEQAAAGIPEGVAEWDFKLGDWKFKEYFKPELYRDSSKGIVANSPWLFIFLTIGLGLLGGLCYILPKFSEQAGIKNNHIYHSAMTRGLRLTWRVIVLSVTVIAVLIYGISYMDDRLFWPGITALIMGVITALILFAQQSINRNPAKSASPTFTGWLGILTGIYLIAFYVFLYWSPAHIAGWMVMLSPISKTLNGGAASQWFVYGLLYTII
ncbi:MAG: hypothetical protein AAGK47_03495, partial [Bacteroidota bacterium]